MASVTDSFGIPVSRQAAYLDTAEAPSTESLRDSAARLVGKLQSVQANLERIDRGPEGVFLEKGSVVEKSTVEPGLEQLLEACHHRASVLDRMTDALAAKIGPI